MDTFQSEESKRPLILEYLERAIETNRQELDRAFNGRPINAVAWLARNLMELQLWTEYCIASEENTTNFRNDLFREMVHLIKIPPSVKDDESVSVKLIREFRTEMIDIGKDAGFSDIDAGYIRLVDVAKQLNKSNWYLVCNKFFSKYAHTTAISIVIPEEFNVESRKSFYNFGIEYATEALRLIGKFRGDLEAAPLTPNSS